MQNDRFKNSTTRTRMRSADSFEVTSLAANSTKSLHPNSNSKQRRSFRAGFALWALTIAFLFQFASLAFGQYSSNIQGTVFDPNSRVIPGAKVTLKNTETGVSASAESNASGLYRFENLAPGRYEVMVSANGFTTAKVTAATTTNSTAGVDVTLQLAGANTSVTVSEITTTLNPDETRLETTIGAQIIQALPLQNNSVYGIVQAAPGVTGFIDTRTTDNFTNEHTLDANANGGYFGGNAYILDGISVVSNIVTGEVNISPNPDSIQEASLQTNYFGAEYGNASGVVDELTSKSGTNKFHGSGNYLFTNQDLVAGTEFIHSYSPFQLQDVTGSFGGPIIKDRTFFFSSVEMKRASSQGLNNTVGQGGSVGLVKYEDPAFTAWAAASYPQTHGTYILNHYKPTAVKTAGVVEWADPTYSSFCTTPTATCSAPFLDDGVPTATPSNNGLQYNFRVDQYFHDGRDRIFANYYRTTDDYQADDIRPQFDVNNNTLNWFLDANYTHVFSPNLMNIFKFGAFQAGGLVNSNNLVAADGASPSKLPYLSTNAEGISFGSNAWGPATFIQHNYDWNDLITFIHGRHAFKFGADVYHGDDSADFSAPRERPSYNFSNLTDFAADQVFQESGVTFNPLTGQWSPNRFGDQNTRVGAFVQDDWKVKPTLLLTLGLRWDDFGNPTAYKYTKEFPTIDNMHIPTTGTIDSRFQNAVIRGGSLFNKSTSNNWSPRVGFAWSPFGAKAWSVRGGLGLYRTPITLGQALDSLDLNPPNWIFPTFGVQQQIAAIYSFGTSTSSPYGFVYPTIPSTGLNQYGGLVGVASAVNGVDPNLTIPKVMVFQLATEREVGKNLVAGVTYTGSHGFELLSGNNDYNRFAGDLIQNNGTLTRLNPNFGSMGFVWNVNASNYNALILTARQTVRGLTWQGSYTFSHALDSGTCATRFDYSGNLDCAPDQHHMLYGTSSFDVKSRLTVAADYKIPDPGNGHLRPILGGWELSTLAVAQSGNPFTAINFANYCAPPAGSQWGPGNPYPSNCGDYNADGFNLDYPNLGTAKPGGFSRHSFLTGVFKAGDFATPTLGGQGTEGRDIFRGPGLVNIDANLSKSFAIPWFNGEHSTLQLRSSFYNVINRANLTNVDYGVSSATFGRATNTQQPRVIQFVGRFQF